MNTARATHSVSTHGVFKRRRIFKRDMNLRDNTTLRITVSTDNVGYWGAVDIYRGNRRHHYTAHHYALVPAPYLPFRERQIDLHDITAFFLHTHKEQLGSATPYERACVQRDIVNTILTDSFFKLR